MSFGSATTYIAIASLLVVELAPPYSANELGRRFGRTGRVLFLFICKGTKSGQPDPCHKASLRTPQGEQYFWKDIGPTATTRAATGPDGRAISPLLRAASGKRGICCMRPSATGSLPHFLFAMMAISKSAVLSFLE